MKIKCNFKTDEPTFNGRIYPKKVFDEAMNKAIEKGLFIHSLPFADEENKIGQVNSFEENINEGIMIDATLFDTPKDRTIKTLIEADIFMAPVAGYAHVDEDNMVKDDYEISHFFVIEKEK